MTSEQEGLSLLGRREMDDLKLRQAIHEIIEERHSHLLGCATDRVIRELQARGLAVSEQDYQMIDVLRRVETETMRGSAQ